MKRIALIAVAIAAVFGAADAMADQDTLPVTTLTDPAPIIAAERAFAADGRRNGVRESFLRSVAADGILLRGPGVVNAREFLTAQPPDGDQPELFWWPTWVAISNAGDLGVSSGPVTVGGRHQGQYFTVWRREPNGTWRWVFDAGAGAISDPLPAPQAAPVRVPNPVNVAASPEAAMAEVRAEEARLAAAARTDQAAAHLAVIDDAARILVGGRPVGDSRAAIEAALPGWPSMFEFDPPSHGGSSASADLVWVIGPARWTRNNEPRAGHYVHVWRHEGGASGWRLLFAEIVPAGP